MRTFPSHFENIRRFYLRSAYLFAARVVQYYYLLGYVTETWRNVLLNGCVRFGQYLISNAHKYLIMDCSLITGTEAHSKMGKKKEKESQRK